MIVVQSQSHLYCYILRWFMRKRARYDYDDDVQDDKVEDDDEAEEDDWR